MGPGYTADTLVIFFYGENSLRRSTRVRTVLLVSNLSMGVSGGTDPLGYVPGRDTPLGTSEETTLGLSLRRCTVKCLFCSTT